MKKKIKKLLVDALRSGDYKQTFGTYESLDGCFCILGVVKDLYRKHTNDPDICYDPSVWKKINSWAGHVMGEGIEINGLTACLIDHNDYHEVTFEEFADAIDSQL